MSLGKFTIWKPLGTRELPAYLAPAVEGAGFRRLWLGGVPGDLSNVEPALALTTSLEVASGIVNIWRDDAKTVAAAFHRLEDRYPGRFLLGIGTGHPEHDGQYTKPYEAIARFLDELDIEGVPFGRRIVAALGPKVLKLAADRSAGAHPYLVPVEHTAKAREVLGTSRVLVPEHKVILEADPMKARELARPTVQHYLDLANYRHNLLRLGYSDDELTADNDRLIDAVVAHGDAGMVAAKLGAHLEAGANEVAVQLLTRSWDDDWRPGLSALAAALGRYEAAH